jgi:4-amino-4-deoxy-L-arabinose transferase-like glycosyltransferase
LLDTKLNEPLSSSLAPRAAHPFYESSLFIIGAALVLRFAILAAIWRHGSPEAAGSYGFEVGSVAASIASGKGFSSPSPLVETGATAWLCPVYPYLVAGVFKTWGIFTVKSHIILQVINCIFSALVIIPIRAIAERSFGRGVAIAACWLWVILPTAWHVPVQYVWETALSALTLAILFWATLAIRSQTRLTLWAAYGALWALGLMINASFASVLPFLFIWLAWEAHKRALPWLPQLAVASLILAFGLTPWTVRNYVAFHKPIFVRNALGAMLWWGNNAVDSTTDPFARHPLRDPSEAAEFQRLGEVRYMDAKQQVALEFIRSHPAYTARLILRRVWLNWFSVTDRVNSDWSADPLYLKLYSIGNAVVMLLAWYGLWLFVRSRNPESIPFLIVLLFYPLVYYLTVTLVRYRFPIEPIIAILSVYGASRVLDWMKAEQLALP